MSAVSLVRFDESLDSICRAIELCDGFAKLDRSARVLIKPNISYGGWVPIPPFGMVTSARVVEGVLRMLADHGSTHVCIGEGTISNVLNSNTARGYKWTGIEATAKKYGAKLIDFNKGPFVTRALGDIKVGVSQSALDAEFIINLPVLKTHSQVKVSLGFKNLKGCLDMNSRKLLHRKGLDHLICLLNELIKCDLTVIDGIYMLEKGPDTVLGTAHRKDLIIASRDTFACDCVGATILGVRPSEVGYLKEYAEIHKLPLDTTMIRTYGLNIEELQENLDWMSSAENDLLRPAGITGLSVPHPGTEFCSGCYIHLVFALAILSRASPHRHFANTTIISGTMKLPRDIDGRIMLYGACAIGRNKEKEQAAQIVGCPPTLMNTLSFLFRALLPSSGRVKMMLLERPLLYAVRMGKHADLLPQWKRYRAPEFDRKHFCLSKATA